MSDAGKNAAIAELRREVGFGCPVCRSPFLTWHHFDPPVHGPHGTGIHWRSEGIIAMCPICHADADEKGDSPGAYSIEELRAMKESHRSAEDVKGHFPTWQDKKALLVRMGGCYADTLSPLFSVNEVPQIGVGRNEVGLLTLSFVLRDRDDRTLLEMKDNWLTAFPNNIHDMIVTPKTKELKVWLAQEDVGLQLSFRRVSMSELDKMLTSDRERQGKFARDRMQLHLAQLPPEQRAFCEEALLADRPRTPWQSSCLDGLPEDLREAMLSPDPVGTQVKRWAERHCAMDDGLIPLLDFEQMSIYHHGQRLVIKDGVAGFLYYCAAFNNQKGAINVRCPCKVCSPQTAG
jgi:hypothetical protein